MPKVEAVENATSTEKKRDYNEEVVKRGNWGSHAEFILSSLGYAVGLGNVWRFPYLCYKNGGGAFLIPYILMLFFVGMPIFLLEMTLGQFSSKGSISCWEFSPIFRGIGFGMLAVSAMIGIYYNIIMAWSLYYLFASFTSQLPWRYCGNWADQFCSDFLKNVTLESCTNNIQLIAHDNGTCYNSTSNELYGIYNKTLAKSFNIESKTAPQQYFDYVGLQVKHSPGFENFGELRWDMSLCCLLAWLIIFMSMCKGIKLTGKIVYFTALFPYVVLLILFINGLLQEGYWKGITFYITPDLYRLADPTVWKDAAVQIFYSLAASSGGLITLSSYNKFKKDVVRDTILITLLNSLTSVFAGFVIFSYLGHLAHINDVDVKDVSSSGVGLAFVIYPYAVMRLPAAPIWSILFFFMLITLGMDSLFADIKTIVTSIMDLFPAIRKYQAWLVLVVCLTGFLLGLPMCTQGGIYLLTLMDDYVGAWNVMFMCILECISVAYIYGARRLCNDIEVMTGPTVCGCIPWWIFKWWWTACWYFFTPILVAGIMIFSWVDYIPSSYGDYIFPSWVIGLGWLMTLVVVVLVVVPMVVMAVMSKGTMNEMIVDLFHPTKFWGPALIENRQLINYVPNFDRNPYGVDMDEKSRSAYIYENPQEVIDNTDL